MSDRLRHRVRERATDCAAGAPYLADVHAALPRLLALYDTDPLSGTAGLGDRAHWAWRTIDFANATFQGASHGLAMLIRHDLVPAAIGVDSLVERINAMVEAIPRIVDRRGGLAEAYPGESSFCVTALVLFDSLRAIDLLDDLLTPDRRRRWLDVLQPLARFLRRADESHGFIANHLATAAAALYRWDRLTGEGGERGAVFVDRLLRGQSREGWFPEYGGFDPGYQTLCLHYLADLHLLRPDLGLQEPLIACLRFLAYFAHPDATFGGLYGARGTRFCVPSGIEALRGLDDAAAQLAGFVRQAVAERSVVPLAAFDAPNLPVMFNAWAWAAALSADDAAPIGDLPAQGAGEWRREFPEAGIVIDKGSRHYTIVSWKKGGVVYHFVDGGCMTLDPGVAVRLANRRIATSQLAGGIAERSENSLVIRAPLVVTRPAPPSRWQFLVLRLLCATLLRWPRANRWFKRALAAVFIVGGRRSGLVNRRAIRFGARLEVVDTVEGRRKWTRIAVNRPFNAIPMASRGYWIAQDDFPPRWRPSRPGDAPSRG